MSIHELMANAERRAEAHREVLTKERADLWAELHALVQDESHQREAVLRARIKAINAELWG